MTYDYEIRPEMRQFDQVPEMQFIYQQEQQSPVRIVSYDACTNTSHKENPIDVSDKNIECDIQDENQQKLVNVETNTSYFKIDDHKSEEEKDYVKKMEKMDVSKSKDEDFGLLIKNDKLELLNKRSENIQSSDSFSDNISIAPLDKPMTINTTLFNSVKSHIKDMNTAL